MKTQILPLMIPFLLFPFAGKAQDLQPTPDSALVNILLVDANEKPVLAPVELVAASSGKSFSVSSNQQGIASLLVPKAEAYILNLKDRPGNDTIPIPDKPLFTLNIKLYYEPVNLPAGYSRVSITVITSEGKPLQGELVTIRGKTGNVVSSAHTNNEGKMEADLPTGTEYIIDYEKAPNYDIIEIPPNRNQRMEFTLTFDGSRSAAVFPSLDKTLVEFTYLDLDSNAIAGDTIFIREDDGPVIYTGITDTSGQLSTLLPNGKTYYFSTPVFSDFEKLYHPTSTERHTFRVTLHGVSSEWYHSRIRLRREALRKRDSLFQEYKMEHIDKINYIKETFAADANLMRRSVESNPRYFVENNMTVSAALYRNLNRWKNLFIVTDVTCSMLPYLREVLLWHAMRFAIDNNNQYIFFNDGDGKSLSQKIIGKTGGLYYTDATEFDSIYETSFYAKSFGCSGDSPENDFEALLAAIKRNDTGAEIILVADNYSDVRDYELLKKIHVPIRIILCGVEESVNEQYLDLAYHTHGSVHSIEDDLFLLKPLAEGKRIQFMGKEYVFTEGRFFYVEGE